MKAVVNMYAETTNFIKLNGETSVDEIFKFAEKNDAINGDKAAIAFDDGIPMLYSKDQLEAILSQMIY
jgi:hypothetical protein